ncbi:MAG TPA: type I-U CRISPR-associated helicase/endonuclease Cas3 [Bryobacteraceae bacterium]|nr:type I-U CRISPR-associated helicase/endonuclease Cas3 [Bryobacteraceae bacterium]
MTPLAKEQFANFFRAVHGYPPFEWQSRLAREVFRQGWPDVIRVPTACGKTSVIDIALFELALQAELQPSQRTAARRICFVIDRRLVVDEVADTEIDPKTGKPRGHAIRLRSAVQTAAANGHADTAVTVVAERLAALAPNPSDPLRVVRLRGGAYRDDGWAADPLTPTVLIATVDQIGSRLLFRGYGVSTRSRPVHAGLLAFDTRILLDEAHLSNAFSDTIAQIRRYQGRGERVPLPRRHRISVVRMSATTGITGNVFEMYDLERKQISLRRRLDASKPTELLKVPVESINKQVREQQPQKAQHQEQRNRAKFIEAAAARAKDFVSTTGSTGHLVVGVVVNRVATARSVFEHLRARPNTPSESDAILLTGRIRPYDRDRMLQQWLPRMRINRASGMERPLFVVATQTVEVGANLDFDALVTEAAPLSALRQRFGRLNRLGTRSSSPAVIMARSDHIDKTYEDPIYGKAIRATWQGLSKTKNLDFGINHLDSKLRNLKPEDLAEMETKPPDTPLMFPAHLDAWVQTDPQPEPDPDVAPFLHGRATASADVQVVWRADLRPDNRDCWRDIVKLMPPRSREALPVPIYEFRRWLGGEATADIADVEGPVIGAGDRGERHGRPVLRWRGPTDRATRVLNNPEHVRPGDTVIVPASYGGTDDFGWNPSTPRVSDVADQCLAQLIASYPQNSFGRPKLRLRLHRDLLPACDRTIRDRLESLLSSAITAIQDGREDPWPVVCRMLQALKIHFKDPERLAAVDALLGADSPQWYAYPAREGLVVVAKVSVSLPAATSPEQEDLESDESIEEETSLVLNGRRVGLSEHTSAVESMSAAFASQCGLNEVYSTNLVEAVRVAACWHDQGKRDPRFQAWLHGSEIEALAALAADRPLAKSGRDPKQWQSSELFGYPQGSRHEFVSAKLFERALDSGAIAAPPDADLIKLLIGTHHGHGLPFPTVVMESSPVEVFVSHKGQRIVVSSDHSLYKLDAGWVDLFWRMVRRYGWWGLAYLEALLVTADRAVSAAEQQPGEHPRAVAK